MTQLSLPMISTELTGRHCLPFLNVERLQSGGWLKPGRPFYCLKSGDHDPITWSGRGQMPAWVKHWLAQGRSLNEIEITA